jgi:hypothetical protein
MIHSLTFDQIDAEDDIYKNQKKPMSYGFSQNAIASTQEILTKYHLLMIDALTEYIATHKEAIDMNVWISNCSFDIATMLTISREQGALAKKEKLHPALLTMTTSIGFLYAYLQIQRLPKPITWTMNKLTLFLFGKFKLFERNNSSAPLFEDRLNNGSERPDYSMMISTRDSFNSGLTFGKVTHLLKSSENGAQDSSLIPRATFLIIAGTETTSTAILGAIYHLTAYPQTYQIAAQEVRSAFSDASEIKIDSTRDLPYLSACINESLRMYAPTPGTFPRVIPPGGAIINGKYVPSKTIVGIPQYAAFHSSENFSKPDEFLPER